MVPFQRICWQPEDSSSTFGSFVRSPRCLPSFKEREILWSGLLDYLGAELRHSKKLLSSPENGLIQVTRNSGFATNQDQRQFITAVQHRDLDSLFSTRFGQCFLGYRILWGLHHHIEMILAVGWELKRMLRGIHFGYPANSEDAEFRWNDLTENVRANTDLNPTTSCQLPMSSFSTFETPLLFLWRTGHQLIWYHIQQQVLARR